jgi:hypothetical protein
MTDKLYSIEVFVYYFKFFFQVSAYKGYLYEILKKFEDFFVVVLSVSSD